MSEKNIKFQVSEADGSIKVLCDDIAFQTIACEGDINFTPLIDALTLQLDLEDTFLIHQPTDSGNQKIDTTIKIIKAIFEKFNHSQAIQNQEISSAQQLP